MRRALFIFILLFFFPLAFSTEDVSGSNPGTPPCSSSNSLTPPFVTAGVKPNILIILDNSLSMDEDFYGNAVGSYASSSKSVVAKQALQNLVTELKSQANIGVMTFSLPSDVQSFYVHNALPFASYNPASYCPNPHPDPSDPLFIATWPPPECQTYCMSEDSAAKSVCEAACPGLTTTLYQHYYQGTLQTSKFPDLIITNYPTTTDPTSIRARYCGLAYPKTQRWHDATHPSNSTFYYNQPDPFYDSSNDGIMYGYCGKDSPTNSEYNPGENVTDTYEYCSNKTGTSDTYSGYSGTCHQYSFYPTDSDWALGFFNWGQQMPWYYVGPTWFSNSGGSGSPQGYLHVPIYNTDNNPDGTFSTQYNNVIGILDPKTNDSAGYMSCTASNKNTCPYIINSSNTPTAGALLSAFSYYSSTYPGAPKYCVNNSGVSNGQVCTTDSNCPASPSPYNYCLGPIAATCQKNYVIFVTDGLPSTLKNGTQTTNLTQLEPEVLGQLDSLKTGVTVSIHGNLKTFPVQTYFLGLGLTSQAKTQLDQMAVHGGTVLPSGHAYYADNPSQLNDALESIAKNLLGQVSSGTSVSILSEGQVQDGSNVLQGVFYPAKYYGQQSINWTGYLYDFWFSAISTSGSSIREDTDRDFVLDLKDDWALKYVFNTQSLSVNRYSDPIGNGKATAFQDNVGLDSLSPIWEAGRMLYQRTAASRRIYTPGNNGDGTGRVTFDTSNTTLITPGSSPLGTASTFDHCLQGTSDNVTLQNLISYVRGTDININYCSNGSSFNTHVCTTNNDCVSQTGGYTSCLPDTCRNRTMRLCTNGTDFNSIPCSSDSDCKIAGYSTCGPPNVWKLGDIVYSTPKFQIDYKYCTDGTSFNSTQCSYDTDCTIGNFKQCQKKENVVFVGANDGMLHAFKSGVVSITGLDPSIPTQQAKMTGIPTTEMGNELWGFIPTNSLPYLRCLAVPPPGGCHLYYNDLSPYITTMNSGGVPHTVLIGGMRLGGGSITTPTPTKYCFNSSGVSNSQTCSQASDCPSSYNSSCSGACLNSSWTPTNQHKCSTKSDCTTAPYTAGCSTGSYYYVNAPSDTCPSLQSLYTSPQTLWTDPTQYNPSSCTGLSSYYALDITDVENPKLLWEFTHPLLGYSYSGPAVIHKWSDPSNPAHLTGDQYYVMFLSGPTNPTDGSSTQDLQAFVLTLGADLKISSFYYKDLGISNGFGGRLLTSGLDVNADGYTDFVFFGYSGDPTGTPTGWQGGIAKVNTNNTDPGLALNPSHWTYDLSTYSKSNISNLQLPITAQVAFEKCFNNWYLFAGNGRYFFPQDNYGGPAGTPNLLIGIPFTCDQYNQGCTPITSLNNAATSTATLCQNVTNHNFGGAAWEYPLDVTSSNATFLSERMYTDPTTTSQGVDATSNVVFFTTAEPTTDACGYGGQSRVWGMNCATGAAISDVTCPGYTPPTPTGTLYLQTSTGAINQIDISKDFTVNGNRATGWIPGMAPETRTPPGPGTSGSAPNKGQLMQWMEK